MNKLLTAIFCLFALSCAKQENKEEVVLQNPTPEVLNDSKKDINPRSISRKYSYGPNIIDELYKEAKSKDPELRNLSKEIAEMSQLRVDSLAAFNKYSRTNKQYWRNVKLYVDQLNDSTLKNRVRATFLEMERNYDQKIAKHNTRLDSLGKKQQVLNDREILMKLIVTLSMMQNYQENELPDIQSINYLLSAYDTRIRKTEPYIKMDE